MAFFAHGVLLSYGVRRILIKTNGNGVFAASRFHVGPARPVTSLTSPSFQGSPGMGHGLAHGGILEAVVLVLMTGNAGFATHIVAIAGCRRGGFGLFLSRWRICGVLGRRLGVQANGQAQRDKKKSQRKGPGSGNA